MLWDYLDMTEVRDVLQERTVRGRGDVLCSSGCRRDDFGDDFATASVLVRYRPAGGRP